MSETVHSRGISKSRHLRRPSWGKGAPRSGDPAVPAGPAETRFRAGTGDRHLLRDHAGFPQAPFPGALRHGVRLGRFTEEHASYVLARDIGQRLAGPASPS